MLLDKMVFFHGFRRDGFRSMVLDAFACINMYCNIEGNKMKNQAGSPSFGIQGKISMYTCFMCYALIFFIFYVLEFICREFLNGVKIYNGSCSEHSWNFVEVWRL